MVVLARQTAAALALGLSAAVLAGPAAAQSGSLELELNTAADVPEGCRLTYVATNNTAASLSRTSYEIVAFNGTGEVSTILVLEFGALPQGKTRVVQFDLPQMACANVSRLLVNDQRDCAADDGAGLDLCMKSLAASSRVPNMRFGP